MQSTFNTPSKARACEACRNLKIRCLPSDQEGTCQKCLKLGKECHVKPPAARSAGTRGKHTSRTRVAEMEKKLDGLVALLTKPGSSVEPETMGTSPNSCSPDKSTKTAHKDPGRGPAPTGTSPPRPSLEKPAAATYNAREDYFYELFDKDAEADDLLELYRDLSSNFPFVIIPPQATVYNLRRERPMLLLSILTSASMKNRSRQIKLEQELRAVLSDKIILKAEKSLDLLQAILLHLAWYIFHYKPHTQILNTLIHLALGLIMELGYDKPPQNGPNNFFVDPDRPSLGQTWNGEHHMDTMRGPQKVSQSKSWNFDIQRAVLGCWLVSSNIGISFRKSNNMKYTPYLDRCCTALANAGDIDSDQYLVHVIRGQCLAEDFEINMKSFHMRYDVLKKDVDQTFAGRKIPLHVVLALANLAVYVNEAGLHLPLHGDGTSASGIPSESTRIAILSLCLKATKEFFEKVLDLPLKEFSKLNLIDYLRITYAIVVMSKLSLGQPQLDGDTQNPIDTWDSQYVRITFPLAEYLQQLFQRAQALHIPQPPPPTGSNPIGEQDVFFYFSGTVTSMKAWYEKSVRRKEQATPGHEPSPLEVMHEYTHDERAIKQVANLVASSAKEALLAHPETLPSTFTDQDYQMDDFWSTMLTDWPSLWQGSLDGQAQFGVVPSD